MYFSVLNWKDYYFITILKIVNHSARTIVTNSNKKGKETVKLSQCTTWNHMGRWSTAPYILKLATEGVIGYHDVTLDFSLAPIEYEFGQAPGPGTDATEKLKFSLPSREMKHALNVQPILYSSAGETLWRRVLKLFIISKVFFRVPLGILKVRIRFGGFPQLLLISELLLKRIIIIL